MSVKVVVPAADGSTDFSVLQNELKAQSTKIALVAFDLLYLNGNDLRKLPLHERKAQLRKIIQHTDVQFSDSFEIDGAEMFAHACKDTPAGSPRSPSPGSAAPKSFRDDRDWLRAQLDMRQCASA